MTLSETLIKFCSPVFAGLKPSYLIMVKNNEYLNKEANKLKPILKKNGFRLRELGGCINVRRYLLFNEKDLEKAIHTDLNINLLKQLNYKITNIDDLITQLYKRIETKNLPFPHEIGIFLGYPYSDTIGFINNKGENEKYCGYWKVYANVEQAKKNFLSFDMCKKEFCEAFESGCPFEEIINKKFSSQLYG
ncbi:MAG: DUF3793 family protein [Sphaerochaetaceae bacterium]|nr:DUF3793 family protein [Sphaerochaetaceae bacterium]MDC7249010.1 DUF3793 family protein [Sphaerochaetaceae bacterium]